MVKALHKSLDLEFQKNQLLEGMETQKKRIWK